MFDNLRIGKSAKTSKPFTPEHPNPAIGKTHGISLMLHGKHSEEYRNAMAAILRRGKDRKDEGMSAEEAVKVSTNESAELIAACCDGWEGVTDADKKLKPFNRGELREMLADDDFRWLRLQAEKFIISDTNFFPKPSKK